MTDLPRLAVTQRQAENILLGFTAMPGPTILDVRLPERPTMESLPLPDAAGQYPVGRSAVPIPKGTRVEVGWWEQVCRCKPPIPDHPRRWRPVATATLAEMSPTGTGLGLNNQWLVTLTDIEVDR